MQIKVEILCYPKMLLLYCTNKNLIFFCHIFFNDYSAHEGALKMQFRMQKCPIPSSSTVPFFNPGQNTDINVLISGLPGKYSSAFHLVQVTLPYITIAGSNDFCVQTHTSVS